MADELIWKEECGVAGILCGDPREAAAPLVHVALYALQHRGQESAGIATSDGSGVTCHRDLGLVSQVFSPGVIDNLRGWLGIGHVRYATMGSATVANAQPIVVASPWGPLAVAQNGNLINAPALRAELEVMGAVFTSTTDTEVIGHLIARAPVDSAISAVEFCMRRLEGAFTVTVLVGDMVIGFRDRHAIRPLVLGRGPGFWAFASETCALDHIGGEAIDEVGPGEMVILRSTGVETRSVLPSMRQAHCVFEYIYFARPDTSLLQRNVHQARRAMGRILAREHPADADVIVGVPDSGTSAAMGFAEASGIPLEVGLVKNRYVGRTFIQADASTRDAGVRIKLNPVVDVVRGRRVVLVDDSIVRGTTGARIVTILRRAGAREVHLRISSPPIRHPCFYGIDTSSRGQLLASSLGVDQIRQSIGADSLGYLSQTGLVEALNLPAKDLCMACLDGQYPTRIPTEAEAGRLALERAEETTGEVLPV
jgi:amidophosphoribosyltransferase